MPHIRALLGFGRTNEELLRAQNFARKYGISALGNPYKNPRERLFRNAIWNWETARQGLGNFSFLYNLESLRPRLNRLFSLLAGTPEINSPLYFSSVKPTFLAETPEISPLSYFPPVKSTLLVRNALLRAGLPLGLPSYNWGTRFRFWDPRFLTINPYVNALYGIA